VHIPVDSPQDLGRVVRTVRRAQRIRQDDLAPMVNTSHVTLMNIERGKDSVGIGRVMDVLRELGVRVHLDVPPEVAAQVEQALGRESG